MKIPFLSWRLKSSNGRRIRNNECWLGCYLHEPKVHTRNTKPLAAVGFRRFDNTGNFSQFLGTFLLHLQHACFYEIILHSFKQQTISSRIKVLAINISLSEHRSGHKRVKQPTVCHLHVNIRQMSIINQSAFLIWNKATVGTLQYSIWKWNFVSSNAIRSRLMKIILK